MSDMHTNRNPGRRRSPRSIPVAPMSEEAEKICAHLIYGCTAMERFRDRHEYPRHRASTRAQLRKCRAKMHPRARAHFKVIRAGKYWRPPGSPLETRKEADERIGKEEARRARANRDYCAAL